MTATRQGCHHGMTEQALVDAIQAWRVAYETTPSVTLYTIAAAIGVSSPTVSKRVKRLGWVVPAAVAMARRGAKPKVSSKVRYRAERGLAPPRSHAQACAPASVWDYGSCAAVITRRGQHQRIEVAA